MTTQLRSALAVALVSAAAFVGPANAAVTTGVFVPDAVEDYEGTPGSRAVLSTLFGGAVSVTPSVNNHTSVDAGDWTDFRGGADVAPSSGNRFGTIFGASGFTLGFTGLGGISGFAGWATAAGVGDDVLEFFDMGGSLLSTVTISGGFGPGDGTMERFSFVSTAPIGSIRLSGFETSFDDLSYAAWDAPSVIPVPPALPLLATALFGLGLVARRRRA
jgi:hypothetical protein